MTNNHFDEILGHIVAGVGVAINVASSEEEPTVEALCEKVASRLSIPVFWWDLCLGFRHVLWTPGVGIRLYTSDEILAERNKRSRDEPEFYPGKTLKDHKWNGGTIVEALDFARKFDGDGLFVFMELHKLMPNGQTLIQRSLKMALTSLSCTAKTRLIMIGQGIELPDDFAGKLAQVNIPLPNEAERREEIEKWIPILRNSRPKLKVPKANDHDVWSRLVTTSATLSLRQISNILRKVAAMKNVVGDATSEAFHAQKVDNLLTTKIKIAPAPDAPLGGFGYFRQWLAEEADYFNLGNPDIPSPKGCVLFGLPGVGKSLAAKIAGQVLGVPVLAITPDLFLGGLVGESERKTRDLLEKLSAAAPAVVWFDEIEKLFEGMSSGGSDGGAGQRVFGQVLNFLQENTSPLFFIATANKIQGLPPELLRVGRFDRIFWADLPNEKDRAEILANHLKRWGRNMTPEDIEKVSDLLAVQTAGYAGSELAAIVERGARSAYSAGRFGVITPNDLRSHKNQITPQSETEEAKFQALREQSQRFAPASPTKASGSMNLERSGLMNWNED